MNSEIFPANSGGTMKMATEMDLRYLGSVPLDPKIAQCCDEGLNPFEQFPLSASVIDFRSIASSTLSL